jgi:hypothetical protein
MRRVLVAGSGLCALFLSAAPVAGQQPAQDCDLAITVEQCYQRGRGVDVGERTVRATTAPQTVGDEAATSIRDFLPRIGAALLTPGLPEDYGALALKLNQRTAGITWQLGAQLNQPALYPPILDAIPEARRSEAQTRLEDRLREQDDFSLSLAITPENTSFGRSFRPHRGEVSALVSEIIGPLSGPMMAAADELGRLLVAPLAPEARGNPRCVPPGGRGRESIALECFEPASREALVRAALSYGQAVTERETRSQRLLAESRIQAISTLLGNQPQLVFNLSGRIRNDLAGPDQVTASFRGEYGFRNLNWLRRQCGRSDRTVTIDAACLQNVLDRRGTREAMGQARRIFLTADASLVTQHDLLLPQDTVHIASEQSWEVKGTAGYGQYFGNLAAGPVRPRIDLDLSYAFQGERSLKEERLVARVIYTLPVTEQLSGAFGAVWANKPEYRGEVRRALSATLGLTYKFTQREQ